MSTFYLNHYLLPNWPAPPHIKACTTTRKDGHSLAPYHSFNFGEAVGDNPEHLAANRQQLISELGCPTPFWLTQVHGCNSLCLDDTPESPIADAAFATQPRRVCAVTTADCLPILVCHPTQPIVAAIHAGWKGLAIGVIAASLLTLPGSPEDYMIWLGPGIGPNHFEVGADVVDLFCTRNPSFKAYFKPELPGKWLGDLYAIARTQLRLLGVKQVFGGDYCTYASPEQFYSFRRDQTTGRMATLIWALDVIRK